MPLLRHLRTTLLACIVSATLASALAGPVAAQSAPYDANTPFALWEVPETDLASIPSHEPRILVKAFTTDFTILRYLDTAESLGFKVVVYFNNTVDYATGTVYPERIPAWTLKVGNHPALYGYLSVKEPSWNGVTLSEMQSLYTAYKASDPDTRVIALLGDTPNFGRERNPWGVGVADMLWVNWYPVTCTAGYYTSAVTNFPKIRTKVDSVTPGTEIWLMVQTHEYRTGNKCSPTPKQLSRQVREGFNYLKADGIIFYTWNNAQFDRDLKRNPDLQLRMDNIVRNVRTLAF